MKVEIPLLQKIWDEKELDRLNLKLDTKTTMQSQAYHFDDKENQKGIKVQKDCTKEYLDKLAESNSHVYLEMNPALLDYLKEENPEQYAGIFNMAPISKLNAELQTLEYINGFTPQKRQLFCISTVASDREIFINSGEEITSANLSKAMKSLDTTSEVEYRRGDYGVLLVSSNSQEDAAIKSRLNEELKKYDTVRSVTVVTAKEKQPLTKLEALNLIKTYKTCGASMVVVAGTPSRYTEKELYAYDRFVRVVRVESPDVLNDEEKRKELFERIGNSYKSTFDEEKELYEKREKLSHEDSMKLASLLKVLNAKYSHKTYVDIKNTILFSYSGTDVEGYLSRLEKIRHGWEMKAQKF